MLNYLYLYSKKLYLQYLEEQLNNEKILLHKELDYLGKLLQY